MRLIPVKQATTLLKRICNDKSKYREIKLLTAKKDRSITVKNNGIELTLIENGYLHFSKNYSLKEISTCRHAVQATFRKEFPRSNRAYLMTVLE
ncbi:hypothetical protein [Lactobacillus amylovorus]|uniref:hypothetical protein n=1 Tax=Lactobacillus amylovorus TaxID=1604 RepID=UPI002FE45F77